MLLIVLVATRYDIELEKLRVTGFDRGAEPLYKIQEVTLMLHTNNPIIKHKASLLNLAEELNKPQICIRQFISVGVRLRLGFLGWKV